MPATLYIGYTTTGRLVSRKSTRSDFTHAAVATDPVAYGLPNFSTSAQRAADLFASAHCRKGDCEVVAVTIVDAAAYRKAVAGAKPAK